MKIAIHHDDKEGFVRYNKGNQEVMVTHPDERVRNTVRHYLTNKRQFTIPADSDPDKKGNRMLIHVNPSNSTEDMHMGLSEMFHHTGVHVNWGHDDNDLGETKDPNEQADKPILKSIFGDEGYDIIN